MAIFAVIQRLHRGKVRDLQGSNDLENGLENGAAEKSQDTFNKNDGLPAYSDIVQERSAF